MALDADVARWWEGAIDEDDLADDAVRQWIVSSGSRPFAFLQDYDPHLEPDHPFTFLPPCSRGLDQFIGEPEMLGHGHGSGLVRAHVDPLFAAGASGGRRSAPRQRPRYPRLRKGRLPGRGSSGCPGAAACL